jgi:hypothetical protein
LFQKALCRYSISFDCFGSRVGSGCG